jgi:hypothetical protein
MPAMELVGQPWHYFLGTENEQGRCQQDEKELQHGTAVQGLKYFAELFLFHVHVL